MDDVSFGEAHAGGTSRASVSSNTAWCPSLRGQPTAVCQLMVLPSGRKLVTQFRPAQGGAENTEERVLAMVCGMVSLMTSSYDKQWRTMLSCSLSGYMVRSLRLSQACEKVRLLRLPREACFDEFSDSQ